MANDFKIISWRYSGNKERVTMAQKFFQVGCVLILNLTRSIPLVKPKLYSLSTLASIIEMVITGPKHELNLLLKA
jgi:hypothetical protein